MNRLLVIEDEHDTVKVLKKRLEKEGYEVIVAYDFYRGIELLKKEHPDLVLLDLMLPAGGGETVLAEMKKDPVTRDIPVIVVTGVTDDMVRETIFKMGADEYIEKPYDAPKLLSTIETLLKKGEGER